MLYMAINKFTTESVQKVSESLEKKISDITGGDPVLAEAPENPYVNGYNQWSIQGDKFYFGYPTIDILPAGFYETLYDNQAGQYFFKKKSILTEEILMLPDDSLEIIVRDITKFWESRDLYDKYDYVYKRGILLYGPPGCGKTSLINLLSKKLIEDYNGIVINITDVDQIYNFNSILEPFKEIEGDRKIIVIFEDIDNFTKDRNVLTKLLNILDGQGKIDNVVNIATTNYPEELEERIANRPSRFDRRYEIGLPTYKVREFYVKQKMHKEDLEKIDLEKWLRSTEGFTLDHLKELLLSYTVLGYSFEDALAEMQNMIKTGQLRSVKSISQPDAIGFTTKSSKGLRNQTKEGLVVNDTEMVEYFKKHLKRTSKISLKK